MYYRLSLPPGKLRKRFFSSRPLIFLAGFQNGRSKESFGGDPPSVISAPWPLDTLGFSWETDPQIFGQVFGERGGPACREEATEADGAAVL